MHEHDALQKFTQDPNSLGQNGSAQRWVELQAATKAMEKSGVLPDLGVIGRNKDASACRVVGTTANAHKDGLVVALSGKSDKAEEVVILGEDGKFYAAKRVNGGYVKDQNSIVANNAADLKKKFKAHALPDGRISGSPNEIDMLHEPWQYT